jgi:hypothetical protein
MRIDRPLAAAGLVLLCLASPLRGAAGAPAPDAPVAVTREIVDLPGAQEPHTPSRYNRAVAFRYFRPGAAPPALVAVLIPGLNSGPNTLDILARHLLPAFGPGLEVWVVAPRATLLQDRRGVEAALATGVPDFALGYYYGALQIDGQRFHLLKGSDVPFMAYWGLDVHLRDVHAIVREVRRRDPAAQIVLGGHSLGGILAAAYAGYDFAAIPGGPPSPGGVADVGARGLAGLLFIDGLPMPLAVRVTPARYLHGFTIPFYVHVPGVENLTDPDPAKRVAPFTETHKIARTEDSIWLDVNAVYAFLRPSAPSYFPFYPRSGPRIPQALRITNAALVDAIFSDQMQPDALVRANVAVPVGRFERMPDPWHINPRGLLDLATGRPLPGEALIHLPDEHASPRPLVSIEELIAAILRPGGDFTEWYFPWRLALDLGLGAALTADDPFTRKYMSLTHVRDTALPMLILGAGRGLVTSEAATRWYRGLVATPRDRITVKIFPELSHLDIEDADPNPALPPVLAFLRAVVHY